MCLVFYILTDYLQVGRIASSLWQRMFKGEKNIKGSFVFW